MPRLRPPYTSLVGTLTRGALACALASALVPSLAAAQFDVDTRTTPFLDMNTVLMNGSIPTWEPVYSWLGQTFTVPNGLPVLQSFVFFGNFGGQYTTAGPVLATLREFQGGQAVGAPLFQAVVNPDPANTMALDTGISDLSLSSGKQYFLSLETPSPGTYVTLGVSSVRVPAGNGSSNITAIDAYGGGEGYFQYRDPERFSDWAPLGLGPGVDLYFAAEFLPGPEAVTTPEPATLLLVGGGLLALGAAARRRARRGA